MMATVNIERSFLQSTQYGWWCYLSINKETMGLGMPWEKEYGYAQAVKVGDTIYGNKFRVTNDTVQNLVSFR
jgi:hypothetical protein